MEEHEAAKTLPRNQIANYLVKLSKQTRRALVREVINNPTVNLASELQMSCAKMVKCAKMTTISAALYQSSFYSRVIERWTSQLTWSL